jgi:hypothetical protein
MTNDKNQELREALFELQCVSEIMLDLLRKSGELLMR